MTDPEPNIILSFYTPVLYIPWRNILNHSVQVSSVTGNMSLMQYCIILLFQKTFICALPLALSKTKPCRQELCHSFNKMEQHVLKNVNSCWITLIAFYLETSGGRNYNLKLKFVHFFNTSVKTCFSAKMSVTCCPVMFTSTFLSYRFPKLLTSTAV
jgi:hypothetical protein